MMIFFSSALLFTLTCFLGAPAFAQQNKFSMTTSIVCTDEFNGGTNCNNLVYHLTSKCSQNITVWYQFKICNPNSFAIVTNGTSSKMKSQYYNYGFSSTSISPGGACLTYNRKGVLRDCDKNSTAILSVNAKGPNNSRGYSFTSLTVEPKLITDAPAKKGSSAPTKFRQTRKPTKKPTRKPSRKPTVKAATKKPTSPTRKPTKFVSKKPTLSICGVVPGVRSSAITNTISSLSAATALALTNSTSPQSKALSWLVNQDGLKLCPGDLRIPQRFIAATFYFSTQGDSWVMCGLNSTKTCSIGQTLTFVPGDNTTYRYANAVWLTAVDECLWGGIACFGNNGTLERIEFNRNAANKLRGTIPGEITLLSSMRTFVIESCCSTSIPTYNVTGYAAIRGTIPSGIGNLQSMFTLNLAYNFLTGTVPASIVTLSKLREISLQYNNLVGQFPSPNNAQLTKIKYVRIESNSFNGGVPNIVGSTQLENFTLHANNIKGQMPQAICKLRATSLVVLTADCLASAGVPADVNCPCCTQCF